MSVGSDLVSVVCGKVINFDILMICSTKRSLHIKFRLVRVVVIVASCVVTVFLFV